jgi:hypothetical protein
VGHEGGHTEVEGHGGYSHFQLPGKSENVQQDYQTISQPGQSGTITDSQRADAGDSQASADRENNQNERQQKGEGKVPGKPQDELLKYRSRPFAEYLREAVKEFKRWWVEEAEEWQAETLFQFVRLVKSHPSMGQVDGAAACDAIAKVFRVWAKGRKELRSADLWAVFLEFEEADAVAAIIDVWDRVRYLLGQDPLDVAMELARRVPLNSEGDSRKWTREYDQFLSLAGWLQVAMGNRSILLPVERVGELLGVKARTVSRYRDWACADGVLVKVKGACKGRAAEFQFNVADWSVLNAASTPGTAEAFEAAFDREDP